MRECANGISPTINCLRFSTGWYYILKPAFDYSTGVITTDPPTKETIDALHLEGGVGYFNILLENGTCVWFAECSIVRVKNNNIQSYGIYDEKGENILRC